MPRVAFTKFDGGQNSFSNPADIGEGQLALAENVQNNDKGDGVQRRAGVSLYKDLTTIKAMTPVTTAGKVQLFTKWISRIGRREIACVDGKLVDVTDAAPANWTLIRNDMDPTARMSKAQYQDKLVVANGVRSPIMGEYVNAQFGKFYGFNNQVALNPAKEVIQTQIGGFEYNDVATSSVLLNALGQGDHHMAVDSNTVYSISAGRIIYFMEPLTLNVKSKLDLGPGADIRGIDTVDGADIYAARGLGTILRISKLSGAIVNSVVPVISGGDPGFAQDIHTDGTNVYVLTNHGTAGVFVLARYDMSLVFQASVIVTAQPGGVLTGIVTGSVGTLFVQCRDVVGTFTIFSLTKPAMAAIANVPSPVFLGMAFDGRNLVGFQAPDQLFFLNTVTLATTLQGDVSTRLGGLATFSKALSTGIVTSDVTGQNQPTVETGAGAGFTGTFDVAWTWTDSRGESGVSPFSVPITVAASGLTVGIPLVFIPNVGTGQSGVVVKRTFYIRDTATGAVVHRQEILDNTTLSVVVGAPNGNSLGVPTISPQCLTAALVTTHEGRLFLGRDAVNVGAVTMSEVGFLDYFDPLAFSFIAATTDGNNQIRAFSVSANRLYVYARNTTSVALIQGVRALVLEPISFTRGSVSPDVIEFGGPMHAIGDDGVYEVNSEEGTKLSWPVENVWRALNLPNIEFAEAAYEPRTSQIWFAVPDTGSAVNNLVLVWDIYKRAWYIFRHTGFSINTLDTIEHPTTNERRIFIGTNDARVLLANEGLADVAAAIAWKIRTAVLLRPSEVHKVLETAWLDIAGYTANAPNFSTTFRQALLHPEPSNPLEDEVIETASTADIRNTLMATASAIMRARQIKRYPVKNDGHCLGIMVELESSSPVATDNPFILFGVTLEIETTPAV